MIKVKLHTRISIFLISILLVLAGCKESPKKECKPKKGKPNLTLLTGTWHGVTHSGRNDFTMDSRFIGELEMNGENAGESDLLYFRPINPDGSIDKDGWTDKLYIRNDKINYITNDYPISNWSQKDSTNFKWFLLGKKYWDDKKGDYKDFATFERKNDSLFKTTGQMILKDSTFEISYYTKYVRIK